MLVSQLLNNRVQELDKKRAILHDKYSKTIRWYYLIPIVVALVSIVVAKEISPFIILISVIISAMLYSWQIGKPYKKLLTKVKKATIQDIMELFHPDVVYTHSSRKQDLNRIADSTGFFRANHYHEEDVLRGKYGEIDFYISEVKLKRERRKKSTVTVFDGLLIKLNIPGKYFPHARIKSIPTNLFVNSLFDDYMISQEYGFFYDTDRKEKLDKELGDLYLFINYLISTNEDVRIKVKGNELILFLKSDMDFLDNPDANIKKPFADKQYVENFTKQINSALFLVETFANKLNSGEIEDRLELRLMEYANSLEGKH